MTLSASSPGKKMPSRPRKSPGWAAFDLQQRQKQAADTQLQSEPFPSLPHTVTSFRPCTILAKTYGLPEKPFSSVISPPTDLPSLLHDTVKNKAYEVGNFSGHKMSGENKSDPSLACLKALYNWADDSLIEDILAAVDNDFDKASASLKAMVSDLSLEEHEYTCFSESNWNSEGILNDKKAVQAERDSFLGKIMEPAHSRSTIEAYDEYDNKKLMNEYDTSDEKIFDNSMGVTVISGQSTCVPVEPEWEEDDVYLNHRKDALKMMRAAARHSKAATNSFLRGDHFSAHQFSCKAQEERESAERLNAKAAHEILSIRNEKNGMWKLDLHGLHASEAIRALEERLRIIEIQVPFRSRGFPDIVGIKELASHTSSSDRCTGKDKSDEPALSWHKPIWLEVITGVGNHSRGEAALPTAVRNFLTENGYRFDEARPGVMMVRPKFRHHV